MNFLKWPGVKVSKVGLFSFVSFFLFLALAHLQSAKADTTLDLVKKRGELSCGVSQGLQGFSAPDDKGRWHGIDVDFCRAVAVAVLGDAEAVKIVPLSAKVRFTALQSGEIDLLARNTTWTMHRDTALGIQFVGVNYYDGQGFIVRKDIGVTNARELDGASICVNAGTTTELNVADFFRSNGMDYEISSYEKSEEAVAAYDAGRCDAYTTDQSGLYAQRQRLIDPDAHMVLPDVISKEPLSPVVRQGDDVWADVVRWVHYAMLNAEELGVNAQNVDKLQESINPSIRRLLGVEGAYGESLGLDNKWAARIIRKVGNYGESFDRNLGAGSQLKIERGLNALWSNGGLQFAPPIR
ncbi:general L-amino acid-binding periplasmic protein AapJ [alpha proteobacterium IMCC14465]|uniref:General L-amino acid-binding periplasmic protein AapJ n=1 Tax=alpha proteobacterium IMCC14465 TaxID=1220535 RepID=J9DIP6_9PROT|nr:general L-amino acid-binding periplasmic protein AapJ [alpha proteobacterium IMCC14465]